MEILAMLRAILNRGNQLLTCNVIPLDRHGFGVQVVPLWDQSSSVIEQYASAAAAVRRHAELSWRLRQIGWERVLGR
jgi:hypothetical protein